MAVSPSRAAEVLAKCARHCCICRRFRPLHLQVHHIVEQSEGGKDDLDNLIAICVSCHCNVHTDTKLTRRFTVKELQLHRENVYRLVADGKLPGGNESTDPLAILSASIVQVLLSHTRQAPIVRPQLPAESIEILLAAVRGNTPINMVRYDGGMSVLAGGQTFGEPFDLRSSARYRNGVNQLYSNGLVEGDAELLFVTHSGYLLADDILAAGAVGVSAEHL
jgi:hypothetical protein